MKREKTESWNKDDGRQKMSGYIARFLRLPGRVILLLPEALLLSAVYRYRMLQKPFEKWCRTIGIKGSETRLESLTVEQKKVILRVMKCVDAACNHTSWESKCMVRALSAKKMLNRRGIPCTLFMGVRRDEKGEMIAHAWLRCGDIYVTGGNGNGYSVTGKYGDYNSRP